MPTAIELIFELDEAPSRGELTIDPQTGAFTYTSGRRDDER